LWSNVIKTPSGVNAQEPNSISALIYCSTSEYKSGLETEYPDS
jgi:hypothetical protein